MCSWVNGSLINTDRYMDAFFGRGDWENDESCMRMRGLAFESASYVYSLFKEKNSSDYDYTKVWSDKLSSLHEMLDKDYEEYRSWMDENLCKSRVNFDDYFTIWALLANRGDTDSYPNIDTIYSESEFEELSIAARDLLTEVNNQVGNRYIVEYDRNDTGDLFGHYVVAFLTYLRIKIDELSSEILSVLFSCDRIYEEKIAQIEPLQDRKIIHMSILRGYCTEFLEHREGKSGYETALGFVMGKFYFCGALVDQCGDESGLSQYADLWVELYRGRNTEERRAKLVKYLVKYNDSSEKELDRIIKDISNADKEQEELEELYSQFSNVGYVPLSVREIINVSMSFRIFSKCICDYCELQTMLPFLDTAIGILNSNYRDNIIVDGIDISQLYDIFIARRNRVLNLLPISRMIADQRNEDHSVKMIQDSEENISNQYRLLDILDLFVENVSISDYMKQRKVILEQLGDSSFSKAIENRLENITERMEKRIESESADQQAEFKEFCESLKKRGLNENCIYDEFCCPLFGGEQLYSEYVELKDENPSFDYSCISILYFTALESVMTKYLYGDYIKWIKEKEGIDKIKKETITREKLEGIYFAPNTVVHENSKHVWYLSDYMELGRFKYFINKRSINNQTGLKEYLTDSLGIEDSKLDNLADFCEKVYSKQRIDRNKAAHGGEIVKYPEVQQTKHEIYPYETDDSIIGMIIEFLSMINPKE